MSVERSPERNGNRRASTGGSTVTRRRALALLGSGLVAGSVGRVGADNHEAEVWVDGGTWRAEAHGSSVYSGGDMIDAIQAAVDNLTPGRTSKETVVVTGSGTVGPHEWDGDLKAVDLPSYTALDVRGTMTVSDSGENLIAPVRARNAQSIEVTNLTVEGNPRYGMWIQSCTDVTLGQIEMYLTSGLGVRIDDNASGRTRNVRLDYAYVEGSGSHGVETYGVDDIEIDTVVARDTGGAGLLLNDTSDATVDFVDAVRANEGGGYAGFRCANGAGPNIHVNLVRSIDCGRGVFTVSASHGITIEEVYLEGNGGNLLQDSRDVTINGGTVVDNGGEGFRIDSRDSNQHPHTRDVTIQNVGIYNHTYGVRETGPDTESNAILDNDFCNNGTDVETYASSTVVEGNTFCQGAPGPDPGPAPGPDADPDPNPDPCEPTPIDPYLNVDGSDWQNTSETSIDAGSSVEFGPQPTQGGSWSWEGPNVSSNAREIVVTPEATSTYIATYTNECGETSRLEFTVTVEQDPTGCDGGGIEVGEYCAQDLDGDGRHRDVNGNGNRDFQDVVAFFEHMGDSAVQNDVSAFDFNENGGIDFNDVVALFEQL